MADRPVDLNNAVRPFRQLQAYASQSLSSLFAEFERLEGLVITLAHYSLPAELVEFTQFNNLPEVIAGGPADQYSRPGSDDSTAGVRPQAKPGAGEKRKTPAGEAEAAILSGSLKAEAAGQPGPGKGQEPGESSRPGEQRRPPARRPVFPVSDKGRWPVTPADAPRRDRRAARAEMPAGGDHGPAQDLPVSSGEGRRPTPAGDRQKGREGKERPAGDAEAPASPRPDTRMLSDRPAAEQIGTGNNGWRLLDTLSHSLLLEGGSGNGRQGMAGRRPRSGAQVGQPPERVVGLESRPLAAPFRLGRGPGDAGQAGTVVEELDPTPVLPPQGSRFRPGSGEHGPIDMDRLAEWINELLQDQARRHGLQIE